MSGDLISRSALLAELSRRLSIVDMVSVAEIVNAVDAVEVVRCKDCRLVQQWKSGLWCDCNEHYVQPDDFCSEGQRRDNG